MSNLTPPQIFDELMEDKKIVIETTAPDFKRLHSYLKVIKSRNKKLYEGLGFDYDEAVIKYSPERNLIPVPAGENPNTYLATHAFEWTIWLEKPTPKASYDVVIINPTTNDASE